MDKIEMIIDRTLAGLKAKVNRKAEEGYSPEGSFNRTPDGRWFMQTMVLKPAEAKAPDKGAPAKPKAEKKEAAAKAPKKAKA